MLFAHVILNYCEGEILNSWPAALQNWITNKKSPPSKEIKIWKSINFKIDTRCKGGKKEKEEKQTAMNEYACE